MDLGIAGKTALVCGASKGLGRGCAAALAHEGVHVTLVARTSDTLDATAADAIAPLVEGRDMDAISRPAWRGDDVVNRWTLSYSPSRRSQAPTRTVTVGAQTHAAAARSVSIYGDRPGELVHMDVKKIGRIHDGGGWKAHGRSMGSTGAKKRARIGYDYVHSVVDDHSRLAYSEILDDEQAGVVTIVGKTSTFHVAEVLGVSRAENLAMIADTVAHLKGAGREVFYDAAQLSFINISQAAERIREKYPAEAAKLDQLERVWMTPGDA